MRTLRFIFPVLAFLLAASAAHANLFVNGDFENPGASITTDYTTMSTNSLPGWTSTLGNGPSSPAPGPQNYYSATNSSAAWIPNPESGSYSVQLDSSTVKAQYTIGNSISQTVSLTANQRYELTFWVSPEADTLDENTNAQVGSTTQINVLLNGGGFSNQNMINPGTGTVGFQVTQPFFLKSSPPGGSSWQQFTLDFTPTISGGVTLTFQDAWVSNLASSNASLDNVNLVAVPEFNPTVVGFVFCLLAVGLHYRRHAGPR